MSKQTDNRFPIKCDVDLTQAQQAVDNFVNKSTQRIITAARQTVSILGTIASATQTTIGRSISIAVTGGISVINILQPVFAALMTQATATFNPWLAIQAGLGFAQLGLVLGAIHEAIRRQGQIPQGLSYFTALSNQFSALISPLSF